MKDAQTLLEEISQTLPEVSGLLTGHGLTSAAEWELTVAQMRVLRALPDRTSSTADQLARRLGISRVALSGLADGLLQRGLVERRTGLADPRTLYLRLSPAGREARETLRMRRRSRAAAALGGLPPQQLEKIADSVALLRQALQEA